MSTYYSFYKKCSSSGCALGLAVLVVASSQMSFAQNSFAADGEERGNILSNLDPDAAAKKIMDNSNLKEKLDAAHPDVLLGKKTAPTPKENVKAEPASAKEKTPEEIEAQIRAEIEAENQAIEEAKKKAKAAAAAKAEEEMLASKKEKTLAEKIGLHTKSTEFLAHFDPNGKRDPFSAMEPIAKEATATDDSWWDESKASQNVAPTQDLYFNGQSPAESNAAYARLPMIKVTGMMQIGGRSAVTAIIENKGSCVLYENDRLVLNAAASGDKTKWFFVKQIHSNGMTLILDDGKEISGKFY